MEANVQFQRCVPRDDHLVYRQSEMDRARSQKDRRLQSAYRSLAETQHNSGRVIGQFGCDNLNPMSYIHKTTCRICKMGPWKEARAEYLTGEWTPHLRSQKIIT